MSKMVIKNYGSHEMKTTALFWFELEWAFPYEDQFFNCGLECTMLLTC